MIKLKKMLLIHWFTYQKQVIEFDDINFLTGPTASGKSTIIDALQIVLLGEASGRFFNKAANENSQRTLKGYLYGEMGDNAEAGFHYLRSGRKFSSYIVLEFHDSERKRDFCTGVVFDCPVEKSDPTHKWFILHKSGIPENLFIDEATRKPYSGADLKTFLMKLTGGRSDEFSIYLGNAEYQKAVAVKYGNINQKYRTLLRKAVPFKPISNITQFITEAVCEVNNPVNIIDMQNDIRKYKELENDAERIQKRITALREISEYTVQYAREWDKYLQQKYIVEKAREVEKAGVLHSLQGEVDECLSKIACIDVEYTGIQRHIDELQHERDELFLKLRSSDAMRLKEALDERIGNLRAEIKRCEALVNRAFHKLKMLSDEWFPMLEKLRRQGIEPDMSFMELIRDIRLLDKKDLADFSFIDAAASFHSFRDTVMKGEMDTGRQLDKIRRDIDDLDEKIENLENGIKPFPPEVAVLKGLLERKLSERHGKDVGISVLADELEIQDESWRNAIENVLMREKFYLLVDEEYLDEAIDIYENDEDAAYIYATGIIDTRKTAGITSVDNSLFSQVSSENRMALSYVGEVLGGITMVDDESELQDHDSAITSDSIIWKDSSITHLGSYDTDPFIGQAASRNLLERFESLRMQRKQEELTVSSLHAIYDDMCSLEVLESREAEYLAEDVKCIDSLEGLSADLRDAEMELEAASESLIYVSDMERQISELEERKAQETRKSESMMQEKGSLNSRVHQLMDSTIPAIQTELEEIRNGIMESFDSSWINDVGEPRFQKENRRGTETQSLSERFNSAMSRTHESCEDILKSRRICRNNYNQRFNTSYDAEVLDNAEYDKALEELEANKLPEYLEKIKEAKVEAYGRFRDDFIYKIKSNIQDCQKQIRALNRALAQSVFATDSYRFEVKSNPQYRKFYDMFMDESLMDIRDASLFSDDFNNRYADEIQELFDKLIVADARQTEEERQRFEKNVAFYTDYRNYLLFDLIVRDGSGREQHLSKTLNKKSGGETQIPFYIALLASFNQVCRVRNENDNNTIRLIILDEAFSKMDGERIKVSIELLKAFGLQAIFSAPPEKINDISPLSDKTLIVYRDDMKSTVRDYSVIRED